MMTLYVSSLSVTASHSVSLSTECRRVASLSSRSLVISSGELTTNSPLTTLKTPSIQKHIESHRKKNSLKFYRIRIEESFGRILKCLNCDFLVMPRYHILALIAWRSNFCSEEGSVSCQAQDATWRNICQIIIFFGGKFWWNSLMDENDTHFLPL